MTDEKNLPRRLRRKLVKERGQKWGEDSLSHNKSTEEFRQDQVAYAAEQARRQALFDALPPEEKARIAAEARRREQDLGHWFMQMLTLTADGHPKWPEGGF